MAREEQLKKTFRYDKNKLTFKIMGGQTLEQQKNRAKG